MPPGPSRRPGARRPAGGARSAAPPRKKGTPPIVIALLIAVPILGIGITLALRNPFAAKPVVEEKVEDPNIEIDALLKKYDTIEKRTREILGGDPESSQFPTRVKSAKAEWERWRDEFDVIFGRVKNPDGSWPAEYQRYSRYRAEAGTWIQNLIRKSEF